MGTRKKILLASLVSLMMVFTLAIGLAPSGNSPGAGAADAEGRLDMVDLLDMMLGVGGAGQVAQFSVASQVNNVTFRTPEDNAETPIVPLPLSASAPGAGDDTITFVANDADPATNPSEIFPEEGVWQGDVFSPAVQSPFFGALDLGSFVTGTANVSRSIAVYGLLNAVESVKAVQLAYELGSDNFLSVTVTENEATVDSDNNGLPDNLFSVLPGEIWVANKVKDGELRTTVVANLDDASLGKLGFPTLLLQPTPGVTVEVPTKDALVNAGVMDVGEDALAVIQVSSSLLSLLDEVDGDSSTAARSEYVDRVVAAQPTNAPVEGANWVDIAIVYTTGGGTGFDQLSDLGAEGLSANIIIENLGIQASPAAELWRFPTTIATDGGGSAISTNIEAVGGDPGDWEKVSTQVDVNVAAGIISANLDKLSVFVPFQSGLTLQSVEPNLIPENTAADLTLTGIFATRSGVYSIAQAAAAYRVYIGGEVAPFRDGPEGGAISEFDGENPNFMYVTSPQLDSSKQTQYDVEVVDLADPANSATLAASLEVSPVFSVTTSVEDCAGASVILSQTTSGFTLGANNYLNGETVTAEVANPCADKVFLGWRVDGGALQGAGQLSGFTFTVTADTTLEAVFGPELFTVTTVVTGSATAAITLDPTSSPGQPLGTFEAGTNVEATVAGAGAGEVFTGWRLNGVDTGITDPTLPFTVTSDITLEAVFDTVGNGTVSVSVVNSLSQNVTVVLDPSAPGNVYPLGTSVTASVINTAESDVFDQWVLNGVDTGETDPGSFTFTVNAANVTLVARFQPPVVTPPTITSVSPDNAWIFGGVVAVVNGTNLDTLTSVNVGGTEVFPWNVSSTSIEIAIPQNTSSTADTFQVALVVTNDAGSASTPFTYKNVETANGVTSTAFILGAGPVDPAPFQFRFDGNQTGTVDLPQIDSTADRIFGLTRASSTNRGALETPTIPGGAPIPGIFDFSIHLYQETALKQNTPAGPAALFSDIGSDLLAFDTPIDPATGQVQASTPILLSFPIDGTGLTNAIVREGATLWGLATEYDYVDDETTIALGAGGDIDFNTKQLTPVVNYQSTLHSDEADPAVTDESLAGNEPDMIMEARLYSLNAFSLREGATLPQAVTAGIRLAETAGTLVIPNLQGNVDFTIVSPRGGLAWIDRLEYVRTGTNTVLATQNDIRIPVSNRGEANGVPDEFRLEATAPQVASGGIVDIRIFLEADTANPAATLERVLEYRAPVQPAPNFLLLILGLIVAILGLAAGGDSSGSGGGPCFIASAAYGTPMAGDVEVLRSVRDAYLLDSAAGAALVDAYYRVSPAIANAVAQSPVLAAAVRVALVPVVFAGKLALSLPGVGLALTFALASVWYLRSRKTGKLEG